MKLKVRLFGKNAFINGSAYSKKALPENYYRFFKECKNCKAIILIYIKKGVKINDIITAIKCSNCECRLEKE